MERPPPLQSNAFLGRQPASSVWEAVKLIIPGLILGPVRCVFVVLCLLVAMLASMLARYVACTARSVAVAVVGKKRNRTDQDEKRPEKERD